MLETRKNISLTGNSYVEKEANESGIKQRVVAVYLSASIPDDGSSININKTIQDKTTYLANKEICDADMKEFEAMAFNLIS